jgi:hypothetical protein
MGSVQFHVMIMTSFAVANSRCLALDWEFEGVDGVGGQSGNLSGSGGISNDAGGSSASSSSISSTGGPPCGNGACESGEGCGTCPDDCACSGGQPCQNNTCVGCGQQGQGCCNGSSCSPPYVCTSGICQSPGPVCGNGTKEAGEVCDSNGLAGATCQSRGYAAGTLSCKPGNANHQSDGEPLRRDVVFERNKAILDWKR